MEGDLETLALVTYSFLCLSMLALLLTVLVLSCLRGLKSNTRSIHSNTAAAMFLSELVFLLGVNQTEQQVGFGFSFPVFFCHITVPRFPTCSFLNEPTFALGLSVQIKAVSEKKRENLVLTFSRLCVSHFTNTAGDGLGLTGPQ